MCIRDSIYGIIWTRFVISGFGFTGKVTKMQAIYGKKLQILSTYAALLHLMEKPVSYTHLDVYKRQGYICRNIEINPDIRNGMPGLFIF